MVGAERSKEAASKTDSQSAEALDKAASSFRDQGQTSMAHTTSSIAKNLSSLANRLEGRSADELVQDVVQLARRSPNTFLRSEERRVGKECRAQWRGARW